MLQHFLLGESSYTDIVLISEALFPVLFLMILSMGWLEQLSFQGFSFSPQEKHTMTSTLGSSCHPVEEQRARWERKRCRTAKELVETEQQYLEQLGLVATVRSWAAGPWTFL